jgi:hypothetical protein
VKVTLLPAQMGLADAEMLRLAGKTGLMVMVDVAITAGQPPFAARVLVTV